MKISTQLLLAFLVIAVIPLATIGCLTYFNTRDALTDEFLSHLESVADIQESRIQSIVEQNLERLSLVSSRTQLRLSLDSYNANPNSADQDKMNTIVDDACASVSSFQNICIITLDGSVVSSTAPSRIDANCPNTEVFIRGQSQDTADTFFLNNEGGLSVYLSGPLYLESELLGVVIIESNADNLVAAITDYTGLGKTGETILASRTEDGDAMFLTPTRFEEGAALSLTIAKEEDTPVLVALSGTEELLTEAVDYRAEPVLAATRYLEDTGWGLVTKIDRAEALAPINNLQTFLITVILLSLVLVTVIALYLTRVITKPISKLTEAAISIGKGEMTQKVDIKSRNEVGLLARSFNEMVASLRKSERRYRTTLDNMLEGCQIIDRKWRYVYLNDAATEHGRRPKSELIGHTMMECYPGIEKTEMFQHLKRCMKERKSYRMENEFAYPDGSKGWFDLSFEPTSEGVFILSVDITKRKQAGEELRKSESTLAEAQRVAHIGSWELDIVADKLTWSDEVYRIFGLKPQQFGATYEAFLDNIHPDDRTMVNEAYTNSLKTKTPYDIVHRLRLKDGTVKYVNERCETYYDDTGKPVRSLGTVQDITELRKAEDKLKKWSQELEKRVQQRTAELEERSQELAEANVSLEEMSRHKSQFLANMSHELRTPLNSIIGYTKLVLDGMEGEVNEEQRQDLQTVYRNSQHLLALINDLLDLSKIEAGKITVNYELFTIAELLEEVIPSVERLAKEKGLTLDYSADPNINHIYADKAKTKQTLINIMGNAVKFTEEGGVKLDVTKSDGELIFSVRDTGMGIKKADLEVIFDSFKQVGPAQVAGFEGTGLGLAISKQFVEMQGGRIWAESRPGKGSTFTFTLPVKKAPRRLRGGGGR